ncbi:hypothetical protein MBM_09767 [Drepanopeziza brunnea f. sp. 'multigermtubi' MB_m1]|uniref:Uncharacterized protein n=1 Tax=Marssonina brunnea f. sp. multigermtubi (strain MB_m1) TaxID=1072389 RepID=K1XI03_MARBU|nr:uncharacterized protein MBM_09767 [Drepanopeziza brunnea f. sp. 'multigermtubi' MB_m1]EKD12074.1 hypothetical protein MBM_09767 [Drepanopeziza brunnea f. sp. 'multigermtubi' MB_m1]
MEKDRGGVSEAGRQSGRLSFGLDLSNRLQDLDLNGPQPGPGPGPGLGPGPGPGSGSGSGFGSWIEGWVSRCINQTMASLHPDAPCLRQPRKKEGKRLSIDFINLDQDVGCCISNQTMACIFACYDLGLDVGRCISNQTMAYDLAYYLRSEVGYCINNQTMALWLACILACYDAPFLRQPRKKKETSDWSHQESITSTPAKAKKEDSITPTPAEEIQHSTPAEARKEDSITPTPAEEIQHSTPAEARKEDSIISTPAEARKEDSITSTPAEARKKKIASLRRRLRQEGKHYLDAGRSKKKRQHSVIKHTSVACKDVHSLT